MEQQYKTYKPNTEPAAIPKRRKPIEYTPGDKAVRVSVLEVGFILTALKRFDKDYGKDIPQQDMVVVPQDAVVVETVSKDGVETASTGAYIYETELVHAALRHRYETGYGQNRTIAGSLMNHLLAAEVEHQAYLDTELRARSSSQSMPAPR